LFNLKKDEKMSYRKISGIATKSIRSLYWLDLRASGLSMLERLSLEEALLRHDDRNWVIVGTHQPWNHKYLTNASLPTYISSELGSNQERIPNQECMIVMGIGGKPSKLLNIPKVKRDNVLVTKRFSGGGTVVLDMNSVWTTVIGRNRDFTPIGVDPYPRSIMDWSADSMFGPAFTKLESGKKDVLGRKKTLVLDIKSCSATENSGQVMTVPSNTASSVSSALQSPEFRLRENDYVFGELKMGGNAQSIVKDGWLHHTSFLWDYDPSNMEYLTVPEKRPSYRGDRSHSEFLVNLRSLYGPSSGPFISSLQQTCREIAQEVHRVTLSQVMKEVIDGKLGGMDVWFEKNRTRIVEDLE
jgi:lipoate-protein ligase A